MDGKVELTIDRYEELTALERNIKAKEKELKDLKSKAIDEKNVLVYRGLYNFLWPGDDGCTYEGKDIVLKNMAESVEEAKKERDRAKEDLKEYTSACFSDRLYYLFHGRLPGMK